MTYGPHTHSQIPGASNIYSGDEDPDCVICYPPTHPLDRLSDAIDNLEDALDACELLSPYPQGATTFRQVLEHHLRAIRVMARIPARLGDGASRGQHAERERLIEQAHHEYNARVSR